MNYYNHHIGDYAKDTSHLSMTEDGAYRRLMDICYSTEHPLPPDRHRVYRLARATSKLERSAVDAVLDEYFDQREDGWHQKRVDEEVSKAREEGVENQARKENERERQRRHRERRKELFDALREYDIVPKWDAPFDELETLLSRAQERHGHAPVTDLSRGQVRDDNAPATAIPIANSQEPIANSHGDGNGAKKPRRKPATAPPESFEVSDEMAQWAVSKGLPAERVVPETEKFLGHHRAKDNRFSDWHQAWANWVLKAVEYGARR